MCVIYLCILLPGQVQNNYLSSNKRAMIGINQYSLLK